MINTKSVSIEVCGHYGKWYVIDEASFVNVEEDRIECLFLLEHELYGDEAACIIVNEEGELVAEDIWNGFSDLEDYNEWEPA